jgi:hypothetical protein
MAQVYKSSAFLQQCFASHRLCLAVKRIESDRVVVACTSCRLLHRLTVAPAPSPDAPAGAAPMGPLTACLEAHGASVGIREINLSQDRIRLRCADCRAVHDLVVSEFETQSRG